MKEVFPKINKDLAELIPPLKVIDSAQYNLVEITEEGKFLFDEGEALSLYRMKKDHRLLLDGILTKYIDRTYTTETFRIGDSPTGYSLYIHYGYDEFLGWSHVCIFNLGDYSSEPIRLSLLKFLSLPITIEEDRNGVVPGYFKKRNGG